MHFKNTLNFFNHKFKNNNNEKVNFRNRKKSKALHWKRIKFLSFTFRQKENDNYRTKALVIELHFL